MPDTDMINAFASLFSKMEEQVDGFTAREIAKATGRSQEWVREQLIKLAEVGKLVAGKKKTKSPLTGHDIWVPSYRVKLEKVAKKKKRR